MMYCCSQPKSGAQQVDGDEQEQGPPERGEVDALAGVERSCSTSMSACVSWPLALSAGDGLLLGHAGRELLAHDALEEDVGGVAQDLGADDVEGHADHGEHAGRATMRRRSGAQHAPPRRLSAPLKSLGFAVGMTSAWPAGPPPGAGAGAAAAPTGRRPAPAARAGAAGAAHATSSSPSWEATISR